MEYTREFGIPYIEYARMDSNVKGLDNYIGNLDFHKDCLLALKIVDGEESVNRWKEVFDNYLKYHIESDDVNFHFDCCRTCQEYKMRTTMEEGDERLQRLQKGINTIWE